MTIYKQEMINGSKKYTCAFCGKLVSKYSIIEHFYKYHGCTKENQKDFIKNYYDTYIEPGVEHVCEICGKPVEFRNLPAVNFKELSYQRTCSRSCRSALSNVLYQERWEKEHPGEPMPNNFKNPEILEKIKNTLKERYGENIVNPGQIPSVKEKVKKTFKERYGNYYFASEEGMNRIKEQYKEKYGVEWFTQTEEHHKKAKETWKKNLGVDEPFKSEDVKEKVYQSKLKNGSFFTSKIEDLFYDLLCEIYGKDDVVRRYRDPRYAKNSGYMFECDLYVKSIDCFIEIQGYKSHGYWPSTGVETPFSLGITDKEFITYESDILKRSIAKNNKLKYKEIFAKNYNYKSKYWLDKIKEFIEGNYDVWYSDDRIEKYSDNCKFIDTKNAS